MKTNNCFKAETRTLIHIAENILECFMVFILKTYHEIFIYFTLCKHEEKEQEGSETLVSESFQRLITYINTTKYTHEKCRVRHRLSGLQNSIAIESRAPNYSSMVLPKSVQYQVIILG